MVESLECNAELRVAEIWQFCRLHGAGQSDGARLGDDEPVARGCHRVAKLAQTTADLAVCENIRAATLGRRCSTGGGSRARPEPSGTGRGLTAGFPFVHRSSG